MYSLFNKYGTLETVVSNSDKRVDIRRRCWSVRGLYRKQTRHAHFLNSMFYWVRVACTGGGERFESLTGSARRRGLRDAVGGFSRRDRFARATNMCIILFGFLRGPAVSAVLVAKSICTQNNSHLSFEHDRRAFARDRSRGTECAMLSNVRAVFVATVEETARTSLIRSGRRTTRRRRTSPVVENCLFVNSPRAPSVLDA